jgi:hypothetical protein
MDPSGGSFSFDLLIKRPRLFEMPQSTSSFLRDLISCPHFHQQPKVQVVHDSDQSDSDSITTGAPGAFSGMNKLISTEQNRDLLCLYIVLRFSDRPTATGSS